MDIEFLRKENNILQQRVLFLESQLTQLRSSESVLSTKLQQINQSRGIVNQKLNELGKQYEEKIRHLEVKVERLGKQNETLIKQGNEYKQEIMLFENRILQKERLLTTFVTQSYSSPQYPQYEQIPLLNQKQLIDPFQGNVENNEYFDNYKKQEQVEQNPTPPPPPPTMRSIEQKSKPIQIQEKQEIKAYPPPPKPKIEQRKKSEEKIVINEFVQKVEPINIESQHNIQQSQNFFNQLASNSFVSEIVPKDDHPQIPDTPFSHNFDNHIEDSQYSQSQNFFQNLAQSNQFSDNFQLQPQQEAQYRPEQPPAQNIVTQMTTVPKFVPKRNKRTQLKVMNASAFQ